MTKPISTGSQEHIPNREVVLHRDHLPRDEGDSSSLGILYSKNKGKKNCNFWENISDLKEACASTMWGDHWINMLELHWSTELFPLESLTIRNNSCGIAPSPIKRHSGYIGHFGPSRSAAGGLLPSVVGLYFTQVTSKHTVVRKETQLERKCKRSEKERRINRKQKYKGAEEIQGKSCLCCLLLPDAAKWCLKSDESGTTGKDRSNKAQLYDPRHRWETRAERGKAEKTVRFLWALPCCVCSS